MTPMCSAVLSFGSCAVIGQPIAHSISPRLHAAFAAQFARPLKYQRIEASPEQFAATVQDFFANGGRGLNVTLPHKIAAFELADVRHPRAVWAGAANTLWMESGELHADNSDGSGLINDLQRLQIPLAQQHIVIIGAGGAAAGIIPLLLTQQPKQITVINRSAARAHELLQRFNDPRLTVDNARAADLIISTVSDGFTDLIRNVTVTSQTLIYDLNYGARAAITESWASQQQLRWHDGLGMLIEQAAISFAIWHGLTPNTEHLHRGQF
jgi:shikimate dehydrogenase